MTIHRSVIEKIRYELDHKEEVMDKHDLNDQMYYAYMTGRMSVVMDWILDKNSEIAD